MMKITNRNGKKAREKRVAILQEVCNFVKLTKRFEGKEGD